MKQQEKWILIKEIYKGLGVNTSVESMEIKAFDIYAEKQIRELKECLHHAYYVRTDKDTFLEKKKFSERVKQALKK